MFISKVLNSLKTIYVCSSLIALGSEVGLNLSLYKVGQKFKIVITVFLEEAIKSNT